ncbi:Zinc finger MYM-type protein 1, partial [Clarias magur]
MEFSSDTRPLKQVFLNVPVFNGHPLDSTAPFQSCLQENRDDWPPFLIRSEMKFRMLPFLDGRWMKQLIHPAVPNSVIVRYVDSAEKGSEGAFQAVYAKTADLTSDPRDEPMRKHRLTQLQDPQERYRNLYMAILVNILEQIPRRFSNLESMLFLELANPEKFDDMRQVFPEEAFQNVLKSYGHHFDSGRLRSELQVLYSDQDLQ